MANPRRSSYSNTNQNSESSLHGRTFSSLMQFLKKPHAFPFLLFIFLLLTWVTLRLQHSAHLSSSSSSSSSRIQNPDHHWTQLDDSLANLIRFSSGFPSRIAKDKRGWLLNPIALAHDSSISGIPLSLCNSLQTFKCFDFLFGLCNIV